MIRPVLLLMVLGTWVALDVVLDEIEADENKGRC